MLEHVTGIDIFIDGHDHEVKTGYFRGTLLAEAGCYTRNIGQILYRDGKWVEELLPFAKGRKEDAKVKALVDKVAKDLEAALSVPLGHVSFSLDGSRAPGVRTMEMSLGDFVADAYLWQASRAMDADGSKIHGAMVNGGSIRSTIGAGKVTLGDLAETLPYNAMLYVMTMKGSDLLEMLESGTCIAPKAMDAFPQVAGIKYTLDTRVPFEKGHQYTNSVYFAPKHPGSRVTITEVGGEPFDPQARG